MPRPLSALFFTIVISSAALVADVRAQTILFVDDDAAPGGDGSSWATAYRDLQSALANAGGSGSPVEEIWVAAGTYRPDGGTLARDAAFALPPDVDLLGGFAGDESDASLRDPSTNVTVLTGDLKGDDGTGFSGYGDNSIHVVTCEQVKSGHVLDGFVIHGGNANGTGIRDTSGGGLFLRDDVLTLANCTFDANESSGMGGAVFAVGATLLGSRLVFSGNRSGGDGGAVRASNATVTISGCEFSDNASSGEGAGLVTVDCAVDMSDTSFDRNVARTNGGGARLSVSEPHQDLPVVMAGCTFTDNECQFSGGGLETFTSGGSIQMSSCLFVRNRSGGGGIGSGGGAAITAFSGSVNPNVATIADSQFVDNGSHEYGGGLYFKQLTQILVTHCRFEHNAVGYQGGGVGDEGSETMRYDDCRFVDNRARLGGGLGSNSIGSILVHGCLFAGNTASDRFGAVLTLHDTTVEHSTITGNSAVNSVGGMGVVQGSNHARHTILWHNTDSSGSGQSSEISGFADANYCCIEGWDGTIAGSHDFSADPRFVDAGAGDLRLSDGSPCVEVGDEALTYVLEAFDIDGHSRVDDGDLDRVLRVDLGALEFTHVNLAITGDPTPGGTVTVETSGTAGLPVLLIFAIAPGSLLVDPIGTLGVALGSICGCVPWDPAPSSVSLLIPADALPADFWVQEAAFAGRAGNLSNVVGLEIR